MARAGAGAGVYTTTRRIGAVLGSATIAVLMEARIAARLGAEEGWAGTGGAPEGMPSAGPAVPPAVVEGLSPTLAESLRLPVAMILLGAVVPLFFERPRHMVRR
jgi:hypothetical protein